MAKNSQLAVESLHADTHMANFWLGWAALRSGRHQRSDSSRRGIRLSDCQLYQRQLIPSIEINFISGDKIGCPRACQPGTKARKRISWTSWAGRKSRKRKKHQLCLLRSPCRGSVCFAGRWYGNRNERLAPARSMVSLAHPSYGENLLLNRSHCWEEHLPIVHLCVCIATQ